MFKSSNETNSQGIKKDSKNETSVSVLILSYFVFRSKTSIVDRIGDKFKILPIGHNARFEKLAEQWKKENNYDGMIITQIFTPKEDDIESLKKCVNQLCCLAELKAKECKNVDIKVFVPENSYCSLNQIFTCYLFGKLKPNQNEEIWRKILGDRIIFDNKKIKVLDYSKMPLEDVCLSIKENDIGINRKDNNCPTSNDARVAAVLCEYAYYLVRGYNNLNPKGNRFLRKILLRDDSDKSRDQNTTKEIEGISIVPNNWKRKSLDKNDENDKYAEKIIEYLELADWDAISFDYDIRSADDHCWVGLSKQTKEDWKESISRKIVEALNKKFSLIGNKGGLNTWFGFSRNSGFSSVIYVNEKSRTVMYCTVGSDLGMDLFFNGDWTTTNLSQFLTGLSPQYQQSVTNAKILDDIITKIDMENENEKPIKLLFIGHSLGGGLASNNAIITSNRHAITFNAAGLNWLRVPISLIKNNPRQLLHPFRRRERVHLFVIKGEILDVAQSILSPTPWLLNSLNLDLPGKARAYSSYKTRKEIEAPYIDGKEPSSFSKHALINFMTPSKKILEIEI